MPFPINESMASVECKVHEEQAPKEPYRDIGKRFQGEERPEGVDSDHGVDGVSEVFRENIGQDDRSCQVEKCKGNEESVRFPYQEFSEISVGFEKKAGEEKIQRHSETAHHFIQAARNRDEACRMKIDDQEDAESFCQVDVFDSGGRVRHCVSFCRCPDSQSGFPRDTETSRRIPRGFHSPVGAPLTTFSLVSLSFLHSL